MRHGIGCIVTAIAIACCTSGAQAQVTPEYSFEAVTPAGPDGFFGVGATVTQSTIGATHLLNSMSYDATASSFSGARTESVIPPTLNDPPGVDHVLFDLTITSAYTGGFADIGVTVFGHQLNAPGGPVFGHQVQFADTESIALLTVGTHSNIRIDLNQSVGPYRPGESFDAIFGPGPNDLTVASAFQFFISKNGGVPLTVFIDNVRLVPVPEPATLSLTALGAVGLGALGRRRRAARGQL
jgi:hypothetical protein